MIPSKCVTLLHAGDRVAVQTAGGDGYGTPGARSAVAVEADRADGKVG